MSLKKLDIGSGRRSLSGYITMDNDPKVGADVEADLEVGIPFEDNEFDGVRASHILEHIRTEKGVFVMSEIFRVLKPGADVEITVPIAGSPQSFQDPTHVSFWNRNKFFYFERGNRFHEAFRKRYSECKVPGFDVIEDESTAWELRIKLRKPHDKRV